MEIMDEYFELAEVIAEDNNGIPDYGDINKEMEEDYKFYQNQNDDYILDPNDEIEEFKNEKNNDGGFVPDKFYRNNTRIKNEKKLIVNNSNSEVINILNIYLEYFPCRTVNYWNELFQEEQENTIGTNVNTSKLYKLGVLNNLLDFHNQFELKFASDGESFYLYNGKSWIDLEIDYIRMFIKNISLHLGVPRWIAHDIKFVDEIYKRLLLTDFFHELSPKNSNLINLENGTLKIDLDGVNLLKFDSNDCLTYQLDFKYNIHARNSLFLAFINRVLPDKDTQKTLQQALGYFLIQDLKLEKAIFLYGTGSNGKSVIFEILNGLFGDDLISNISLNELLKKNSYERAELNHKLINYCSDDSLKKLDHGKFKQLVSGEPIVVRQIYGKPFVMKEYAKLIFNINRMDDADVESTIGFIRRMIFIHFEQIIQKEEQDKLLHKKILKDKAGVFNWIVEGTIEVLKNKEIFISKKCLDFLEEFRKESNIVIRFTQEFNITKSSTQTISFQGLYEKFTNFCRKEGEKTITKKHFNIELRKLGFSDSRHAQGMVWCINMY